VTTAAYPDPATAAQLLLTQMTDLGVTATSSPPWPPARLSTPSAPPPTSPNGSARRLPRASATRGPRTSA
jgi:hypothetical protein